MRISFALFVAVALLGCGSGSPPDEVVDVVKDPQPRDKPAVVEQDNKQEPAAKKPKPTSEPKPDVKEQTLEKERLAAEAKQLKATAIAAIKELGGTCKLDETSEGQLVVGVVLSFTPITDAGLEQLKGLPQLKSLHLRATSVTDAGLMHLKGLTNLEELILNGTLVTDAGAKDLQTALPNCAIRR
jgi:hypothetical protein